MPKKVRTYYATYPAEAGGVGGHDLIITNGAGESHGYVLTEDKSFGFPVVHSKIRPNPPLNIGKSSPADSSGQYDVRDADGSKSVAHINWTGGAGQKSLDGDTASAFKFLDSKNIDISTPGRLILSREATYTAVAGITGPFYSALGYVWAGTINGGAMFSADGTTWVYATGLPPEDLVTSFTTDGLYIYASIGSGTLSGVYQGTLSAGPTCAFALIDTGSTEKVSAVCYHAGFFFASQDYSGSTDSVAAMLDEDNNYAFSSIATPESMRNYTTAGLVQASNSVFWVVSQGNRSYIYELIFNPDIQAMSTLQYAEFPTGFVATCAVGYLSSVYVGGYWESDYDYVGQGQVYDCTDGYASPLFSIGELPRDTDVPLHSDNDNRIWSITAGGRNLYVVTNRGVYRWDIDDGGYSHVFDLTSSGEGTTAVTWDSGSDYSWDGTDYTVPDPPHHEYPTKWDDSVLSGTPVWTYGSGIATLDGGDVLVEITDITLDNTTGTTIEVKTGEGAFSGSVVMLVRDGVQEGLFHLSNTEAALCRWCRLGTMQWTNEPWYDDTQEQGERWIDNWAYRWVAHATYEGWSYNGLVEDIDSNYAYPAIPAGTDPLNKGWIPELGTLYITTEPNKAKTVRFNMSGTTATLSVNGNGATSVTTNDVKDDASSDRILFSMNDGCIIDYLNIASTGAYPPGWEIESLSLSGLAVHNGEIYCPYNVPDYADSIKIDDSTIANPTQINCLSNHGYVTNDTVVISGHSVAAVNGTWTVTKIDDNSFTIPYNNTVGGTGGVCIESGQDVAEGFAKTGERFCESGYLTQSVTNIHTGTLLKDFRYMDVAHSLLPTGASIGATVWVDDVSYDLVGEQNENYTRFIIDRTGYSIKTRVYLYGGSVRKRQKDTSPTVGAINVMWDFAKNRRHTYILDVRKGARFGRYSEDPEDALEFLWKVADRRATFSDRFSGVYSGLVEDVTVYSSAYSPQENNSGVVKLTVREEL